MNTWLHTHVKIHNCCGCCGAVLIENYQQNAQQKKSAAKTKDLGNELACIQNGDKHKMKKKKIKHRKQTKTKRKQHL